MEDPRLSFRGARQSIRTELWCTEVQDFNLGLNILQWISLRCFHTPSVLHEIWIRLREDYEK